MRSNLLDLSVSDLIESASKKAKNFGRTRVLLPPKARTLRDSKIETLIDYGLTAPEIYKRLVEQNLIKCPSTGHVQAYRSIVTLISRIRYAKGAEKANYGKIRKFQRMKGLGFNKQRIISVMKITERSYEYMNYNYWYSEDPVVDPEVKTILNSAIVSKAHKMMRLGYTKRKIRSMFKLNTAQHNYIHTYFYRGKMR
jgi:hypothetical protein